MADKKSGPVKPPIIDAKARSTGTPQDADNKEASARPDDGPEITPDLKAEAEPTSSERPASAPGAAKPASADKGPGTQRAAKNDEKPAAAQSRPQPASATPKGTSPAQAKSLPIVPLAATAAAGALAGVVIAYGLASTGLWPQTPSADPDALAGIQSRTTQIEAALSEQQAQAETASGQIDSIAADLSARIEGLSSAEPQTDGLAAQSDLDALTSQFTEISTRLDALAAGATGDESTEIASQFTELSAQLSDLSARLGAIEPQIEQWAPVLEDASTRLDDLDARIADQSAFDELAADRDRVARLPAAVNALETAIASGSGFASELAEAEALLPSLSIDQETRALAGSGVPTASHLLSRLRSLLPDILAARPNDPDANWAQNLLDQAGAAIALRPTEGDSPQALVGTIETALENGDLATARETFERLPQPMQQAAPGFADDLDAALAARALLDSLRAAQTSAPQAEAGQ